MDKYDTKYLNGIKVLLCLLVFNGHIYNYIGGRYIWGIRLLGGVGARAVDGFFLISGMLTMLSFLHKETGMAAFIKKRILRLYPVYMVCLILGYVTFVYRSGLQEEVLIRLTGDNLGAFGGRYVTASGFPGVREMIENVLLIKTSILGVAWSLSVEWSFYLLFAALIVLNRKISMERILVPVFGISILSGLYIWVSSGYMDPQHTVIRSLPLFFFGMITAQFLYKNENILKYIGTSIVLMSYIFILDVKQNWFTCGIILAIVIPLVVKENAFVNIIKEILSCPFLETISRRTYTIYLVHCLIIPFVFKVTEFLLSISKALYIGVSIVLCYFVVAFCTELIYRFVELPFVKKNQSGNRVM